MTSSITAVIRATTSAGVSVKTIWSSSLRVKLISINRSSMRGLGSIARAVSSARREGLE